MINSFACAETAQIFHGERSRKLPPDIQNTARRKLEYLHQARKLMDLRMPPGNRLEKLSGDRAGQYSVRVNDHWRICFTWSAGGASNVEFVDYH